MRNQSFRRDSEDAGSPPDCVSRAGIPAGTTNKADPEATDDGGLLQGCDTRELLQENLISFQHRGTYTCWRIQLAF